VQEELFYDDEHHAVRRVIEEGKGYKKTAAHLWPDMKAESAYAKLKHAVNGTNGEALRFGQVVEVCLFNERFDALYFFCDRCMHQRPPRKVVKEEEVRLVSVIEQATGTLHSALAELQRLREREAKAGGAGNVRAIG
jgi:hypothetical protein